MQASVNSSVSKHGKGGRSGNDKRDTLYQHRINEARTRKDHGTFTDSRGDSEA